jgi:hypothetical protein
VLYCVASDFFQVARLVAFIEFWRLAHPPAAVLAAEESQPKLFR